VQRSVGGAVGDRRADPCDHLLLELREDGGEQLLLAGELVVQRAARDAGGHDELLRRDGVVPPHREELPRSREQLPARRLGPRRVLVDRRHTVSLS
jgi:hypothetical protein